MRIRAATIENCKSYRSSEIIRLEQDTTLLVGPNAGGKSNTLDIITIVLRKFFLHSYVVGEGQDAGVPYQDLNRTQLFGQTFRFLDKHTDRQTDPVHIDLEMLVGESDVRNVATILDRREDFSQALSLYRNKPVANLDLLNAWTKEMFAAGDVAAFSVEDDRLSPYGGVASQFSQYLQYLQFFLLLARDLPDVELSPTFLYFSPYRSASPQDLNANLSADNFFNLLNNYFSTTSRTSTSLIKIATVFFAEKQRRMEVRARDSAYGQEWRDDPDVRLASRYMSRLGYEWELRLIDANKNVYEIVLSRGGREFLISKASSGEKEILNFLFGIFALRTRGGLLIVDEPELHLHPRWQAVLRELFQELATATDNQFLLSTHSPVFITPNTIHNVRRVAKDPSDSTRVIPVMPESGESDPRSLLHIVNSHNNERIFFADRVVLVEGIHDRIVFQALVEAYRDAAGITEVVEVVEVHGKDNFARYSAFLQNLRVPRLIVADLDYGVDLKRSELGPLVEAEYGKVDSSVLQAKKSRDRVTLAELLEQAIESCDTAALEEFLNYIKGRFQKLREGLSGQEKERLKATLQELESDGVFVLSRGEIEDYLPAGAQTLDTTIELLGPAKLAKWLGGLPGDDLLLELERIVGAILRIDPSEISQVRTAAVQKLRMRVEEPVTGRRDAPASNGG